MSQSRSLSPIEEATVTVLEGAAPDWRPINVAQLDGLRQDALGKLVSAAMIELHIFATGRWRGLPYLVQAVFAATGRDIAPPMDRHVVQLAAGAPGWLDEDGRASHAFFIQKNIAGYRLTPPTCSVFHRDATHADWARVAYLVLSGEAPSHEARVELLDTRQWSPSELQWDIWNALDGRGMTADDLVATLAISRPTLFKKPGGIQQLLDIGILANDRAHGGYFRPDAPPESD